MMELGTMDFADLKVCGASVSKDQEGLFRDIQISKEHFIAVDDNSLIILRQSLLGRPKRRKQLKTDSAQYPLAPTSTAKKWTFQLLFRIEVQRE